MERKLNVVIIELKGSVFTAHDGISFTITGNHEFVVQQVRGELKKREDNGWLDKLFTIQDEHAHKPD